MLTPFLKFLRIIKLEFLFYFLLAPLFQLQHSVMQPRPQTVFLLPRGRQNRLVLFGPTTVSYKRLNLFSLLRCQMHFIDCLHQLHESLRVFEQNILRIYLHLLIFCLCLKRTLTAGIRRLFILICVEMLRF